MTSFSQASSQHESFTRFPWVAGRPRFIEATAPPALENGVKREIRLHGIKDIGAGLNAGLHGVASQEIVAKAVNRRAGQL